MKKFDLKRNYAFLIIAALTLCFINSCKEEVDMSNRFTFKEYTIASYLTAHDTTYSEYIQLMKDVNISQRSASSVFQLISARGKYTVFAPTNKAIYDYLDTLYTKGLINAPSWDGFDSENTLDSIKKVIVYNSILDGTKDDLEPIQSGSFPEDTREFTLANMNDRKLTIYYDHNPDSMFINGVRDDNGNIIRGSLIDLKNRDIYTINGYIHQVHGVIAPSNETLTDVLKNYIETNSGDFIVAAKLVMATGMGDTLSKVKDEIYENMKISGDERLNNLRKHPTEQVGTLPEHRYYGYTLFAESDDFWRQTLGKEPADISPADIQAWVVSQGFYPDAKDNTDYEDEDNALNQFLTYHILPMRIPVDKLVIHYNERGYNYKSSTQFTVPTYELYTTMGKRRLIKLYQCGPSYSLNGNDKIYLNRFPELDNGRTGTYKETGVTPETEGIVVSTENLVNLINAYIYPIDKPLVYDETTRENFQKQRLRFEFAGLFPEFMNNDIRANRSKELWVGMPIDKNYKYLDDIDIEEGTEFYYFSGLGRGWANWQGDEFNLIGKSDITLRIPPVPKAGTYEIRYAVQTQSSNRGMVQVYFGADKGAMPAMGIPLDLRLSGTRQVNSGAPSPAGWEPDQVGDDDYNAEVDKRMRNNGFMKGPAIYAFSPGGTNYARNDENTIRRIIVRQYMYPEETYYLRLKNVLEDTNKQFFIDYIEICAKEVYDNPMTPEDIW